ncbi:MAG: hypothetical protein U0270_08435 [Labilithrix sp.]
MRMHPGVGVFVGVMALMLANCSSKYRDDCQAQVDCEGGNDADVDACVDQQKGVEDVADAYECGDQWGEYTDCVEGKGVCENGNYSVKDTSCAAKAAAALACIKAASGTKNDVGDF